MTEPTAFDAETTPTVTLAGKAWPIGELAWLQLKTCRRALLELTVRINDATALSVGPDGESDDDRQTRQMAVVMSVFRDLSDDDYGRLVIGPVHALLTVLHPKLTREEFESWPTSESERQLAWLAARSRSGLFVFAGGGPQAEESDSPGEADGAP